MRELQYRYRRWFRRQTEKESKSTPTQLHKKSIKKQKSNTIIYNYSRKNHKKPFFSLKKLAYMQKKQYLCGIFEKETDIWV